MVKVTPIVIGNHYWLTFGGDRVPLIFKAYNVGENGVIGGLIYNVLTGEMSFTKEFCPDGPHWSYQREIPIEETAITVKNENIMGEIDVGDLAKLKEAEKLKVDYFFSNDFSHPFHAWPGAHEYFERL